MEIGILLTLCLYTYMYTHVYIHICNAVIFVFSVASTGGYRHSTYGCYNIVVASHRDGYATLH